MARRRTTRNADLYGICFGIVFFTWFFIGLVKFTCEVVIYIGDALIQGGGWLIKQVRRLGWLTI